MDASATTQKYAASAFTRLYTWKGPHSCLALPDMLEELLLNGFEVVDVHRGTRDYERTMRAWALRLDDNHEEIAERWGENVYRMFRVFLWGGAQGFRTNRLQAYTVVAERREDSGPRPGRLRRVGSFAASLR
jgi:cyclopropane-fatty-acyl-phospholipid synthase